MKIAICQINTIVGDIENNKAKIIDGYKRGVVDKVDLVIFPELSLVGYPPLDLVEKKEFRQAVVKAAEEIASSTSDVGLIFGSITEDDDKIGTDIHNSAILCYDGKVQFIQHKTLIPNYDVFDEMRYFDSAKEVQVCMNSKVKNLESRFARTFGMMLTIGIAVVTLKILCKNL